MPRKTLSNSADPFYYEATQQSITASMVPGVPTVDIDMGAVDGDKINGLDIAACFQPITTLNTLIYLRLNNANISPADNYHIRGYLSGGTPVTPETGAGGAPGYNMTLSGLLLAESDFNHQSDVWLRATVFTRPGLFRHSISNYGNHDLVSPNSMIQGQITSNWRDATTKITRLGFRVQASSGLTSVSISSLVVRSF